MTTIAYTTEARQEAREEYYVHNYIKENPRTTIPEICEGLDMPESVVRGRTRSLFEAGKVSRLATKPESEWSVTIR